MFGEIGFDIVRGECIETAKVYFVGNNRPVLCFCIAVRAGWFLVDLAGLLLGSRY